MILNEGPDHPTPYLNVLSSGRDRDTYLYRRITVKRERGRGVRVSRGRVAEPKGRYCGRER